MLPSGRPNPPVNLAGRLPAEESSHLPIDQSHNLVVINDTIGLSQVAMHKAQVRVGNSI